jgi:hypothetical protein
MVISVFIPAIRTFELSLSENGPLWQIITLRALVGNHRVGEFKIAFVTLQDPSRHVHRRYAEKGVLKYGK